MKRLEFLSAREHTRNESAFKCASMSSEARHPRLVGFTVGCCVARPDPSYAGCCVAREPLKAELIEPEEVADAVIQLIADEELAGWVIRLRGDSGHAYSAPGRSGDPEARQPACRVALRYVAGGRGRHR